MHILQIKWENVGGTQRNIDVNRLFGDTGIVNIPFSLPRKIEFLCLLLHVRLENHATGFNLC